VLASSWLLSLGVRFTFFIWYINCRKHEKVGASELLLLNEDFLILCHSSSSNQFYRFFFFFCFVTILVESYQNFRTYLPGGLWHLSGLVWLGKLLIFCSLFYLYNLEILIA
jgi:hypothetical protein